MAPVRREREVLLNYCTAGMLVESVVCWCTFWKDALLRMPVETEEVTEFECASRVCTVLSMTEETPGGGYLARGQYVTQEFSRTPSR